MNKSISNSTIIINKQAYDRGYGDYQGDAEYLDCPYYHGTIEAESWEEGWIDARRQENSTLQ